MALVDWLPYLLDYVAPPRESERILRALTLPQLSSIALRGECAGSLPYKDPRAKALVWELKYYANKRAVRLAGALLAETLTGVAQECLGTPLLIPVPMHKARERERGHNQTELLCRAALAHAPGLFEYTPRILARVRATPPQQGLPKKQRERNLAGSMRVEDAGAVRGRICVVVDDVFTTGATLAEAKRALKAAGASSVECVALAYS